MEIVEVTEDKRRFLPLLLLADEQEDMIDRYLDRGTLYVLRDPDPRALCVVTDEGGVLELKNLAVAPEFQRMGYGRRLVEFLLERYKGAYAALRVGTGDSPLTVPFYQRCGFVYSHRVEGFFLDHYDHPIFEGGVRLTDMLYFQQPLSP